MKGKRPQVDQKALWKRLIGYILKNYKFSCIVVVISILISALTTLCATLFMQSLIDDYIMPLTSQAVPDYAPLALAILRLAVILVIGIGCTGGKHRSVTRANKLYERLKNKGNYGLKIAHRDERTQGI